MTNLEGKKEYIAYMQAKDKYLTLGKKYSALLARVMELDPNILKIAEDIMITGDGLSIHDNRFLISFYKELRSKSKVNKKYYDLLLDIKRTKSELDAATRELSKKRVSYMLRKSGIPPRKVNQDRDFVAAQINDPTVRLIEKISLPEVLSVESAETLDSYMSMGDIELSSGNLVPRTREARVFIKKLDSSITENFNDIYMLGHSDNVLQGYSVLDNTKILDFVRLSADKEHIREIERRVAAKDLLIQDGNLIAQNEKGKRYLSLLTEELSGNMDEKVKSHLQNKNTKHQDNDPRLTAVKSSLKDLDISLDKHKRVGHLSGKDTFYSNLLAQNIRHKDQISKYFAELMTIQEAVATSFVDIKKQLLALVSARSLDIDKLLTLIVCVRYISLYEDKYESKLQEIETILGLEATHPSAIGPESLERLIEKYQISLGPENADASLQDTLLKNLSGKRKLGEDANELLIRYATESPEYREYLSLLAKERAAKRYLSELIYSNDFLYRGTSDITEILAEIAELQIEKKEKLTDINHTIELAHKELWLSQITNSGRDYIETSFADISTSVKADALRTNGASIDAARKEVSNTLAKFRKAHKSHSDEFAGYLRDSLKQIANGGDVSKISADLKSKYNKMNKKHTELTDSLEKEILSLEKRLLDFEKKSPKNIENFLISDIRQTI